MNYLDGFVAAVPLANKAAFLKHATDAAVLFKEYGALSVVESWGDDVADGKLTSFPMAVKLEAGEVVVFSWIQWPSKAVRDGAWEKIMADPRMNAENNPMPFDGKRMVYGGFQVIMAA
ncbi:MAG: DUF1428 domain-containing protein [Burkholderiales bacterium]